MTYNNLKLCGFSVWTRTPKGQLRVRFPQGTVNISGNENSFIAAFFVQNFLPMISGLSEESVQIREIQSILDGFYCVQGKEIAYGRKEGIAEAG